MKGHPIRYSAEEWTWLEANRLLPISEYHAAFCAAFSRYDVSAANLHSMRKRKGWKTGRTGQFERGQVPANKGVKCAPGAGGRHPNAMATQFRKGSLSGRAAARYKPVGTERISDDGYLERKIHDGLPRQSRWRMVHLLEWEALNGPLPEGHCLKCLDGDKLNTAPANWIAIPRALLPRLNGGRHKTKPQYDLVDADLKPAVLAAAKLDHRARELRRKGAAA